MPIDDALAKIDEKEELEKLRNERDLALGEVQKHKEAELELNEQLEKYEKKLQEVSSNQQFQIIKSHLQGLFGFWPKKDPVTELEKGIVQLVTSDDFIEIYQNALILKTPLSRGEYLMMKGIQKGCLYTTMDYTNVMNELAPLGLRLLCPYYEKTQEIIDNCLIDGNKVECHCQGCYDICKVFSDKTTRFATGELNFVTPPKIYKAPELIMDQSKRDHLDKILRDETELYWRGDD